MSQLPWPVRMDCSRYTSWELLMQQPANSTPALMLRKTSRRGRTHGHGLNELTRHLGGMAMTTEIIPVLVYIYMSMYIVERHRIWARVDGTESGGDTVLVFLTGMENGQNLDPRGHGKVAILHHSNHHHGAASGGKEKVNTHQKLCHSLPFLLQRSCHSCHCGLCPSPTAACPFSSLRRTQLQAANTARSSRVHVHRHQCWKKPQGTEQWKAELS